MVTAKVEEVARGGEQGSHGGGRIGVSCDQTQIYPLNGEAHLPRVRRPQTQARTLN